MVITDRALCWLDTRCLNVIGPEIVPSPSLALGAGESPKTTENFVIYIFVVPGSRIRVIAEYVVMSPHRIMLCFRVITKANEELVHIYYSALNFRNVMTASGKIALYGVASDRLNQVRKKTFVYSHLLATICINSIGLCLL